MLSKKLEDALNVQLNHEQYSAQLYASMSAFCEGRKLLGFAHWLRIQAQEETSHANRLVKIISDHGGRVDFAAIRVPPKEFPSIGALFENVMQHELETTRQIGELFCLARSEKDYACEIALQWYVSEQVEEEASVAQIQMQLSGMPENSTGIWYLDSKLGKRGSP